MGKKLTLIATPAALVAFAVPALAAAKPALTNAKHKDAAVGTKLTASSTN